MLSRVREEYNDIKRDYEVVFAKNQTVEKSLTHNKQQLDHFEETKKANISNINKKIETLKSKIEALQGDIVTLPDNVETLLDNKISEVSKECKLAQELYKEEFRKITEIKTNIRMLQKQLNEVEEVGSLCSTCNRPYSDDDLKHKEQNIKKLNDEKI
jgi:chromosome segregation ATPase